MKRGIIGIGAVLIVGLGVAGAAIGPEQYRIYKAKQAVRVLLRDPESAVFTDLTVSKAAICGKVNSRNGYGAMAGATVFVAKDDQTPEFEPTELHHDAADIARARLYFRRMLDISADAGAEALEDLKKALNEEKSFLEWWSQTAVVCLPPDQLQQLAEMRAAALQKTTKP